MAGDAKYSAKETAKKLVALVSTGAKRLGNYLGDRLYDLECRCLDQEKAERATGTAYLHGKY